MNMAAQEAMWLRNFLAELKSAVTGQPLESLMDNSDPEYQANIYMPAAPTFILGDNLGAIETAKQPISSKQSKHIQIRFFKIRELQEENFLNVKHIDGKANTADMFTKVIEKGAFYNYLKIIGMKMTTSVHPLSK